MIDEEEKKMKISYIKAKKLEKFKNKQEKVLNFLG